jgi:hypothetical protein
MERGRIDVRSLYLITAEYTRITAPSTHPCPSAIEDVFALDDRFMTARQIALHHRHSTNGTCDKECMYAWILRCRTTQASLGLPRLPCSTSSPSRSCHIMSCHMRCSRLRRPPSQLIILSQLSKRNTPTCGEKQKCKPTLQLPNNTASTDIRVLSH